MNTKQFILACAIILVWGVNLVIIDLGLGDFPPIFLAFTRFFLTTLPAIFFIRRPTIPLGLLLSYGLIMFALQFTLLFVGMKAGVTPALAAILIQSQVFFTVLIAWLALKEKVHLWHILGGLFAFSGIGLIWFKTEGQITLLGLALVVGSAFAWSIGNVLTKTLKNVNLVSLVVWGSLVAWPPILLLSLVIEGPQAIFHALQNLNAVSIGSVLYLSYLAIFFAYVGWSHLLRTNPLATIAPFTLMIPIISMLSSALILGEPLPLWKLIAAALVISGLAVDFLGSRIFKL